MSANQLDDILEVTIQIRDLLTEIRDLLVVDPNPLPPNPDRNEPAGMALLTDIVFNTPPPIYGQEPLPNKPGWMIVNNHEPGWQATGWCTLDLPEGYDFVYPKGMIEGDAPATIYYITPNARAMYAAFHWKISDPYDYGPVGQKICFIFHDSQGQTFLAVSPVTKGLVCLAEIYAEPIYFNPNVNQTEIVLDEWHFIEWYINLDTTEIKYWMDGILQADHKGYYHPNNIGMDMFQFSPTWGGNSGGKKRFEDHYYFKDAYLSMRA